MSCLVKGNTTSYEQRTAGKCGDRLGKALLNLEPLDTDDKAPGGPVITS